jgi:hypothetical protein
MPLLAFVCPGPAIEAPSREKTLRGTRTRMRVVVLAIVIIAVASALHIRTHENQRSKACAVVDEAQNMDAQPNVDCLEK